MFRDGRRCRPPLSPFSGEPRSRSPLPAAPAAPSAQPTPFVPVTHRTKMPSGRGPGTATAHCKQHLKPSSPIWQPLASVAGSPALPAGFNPCFSEPLFNAGKSCPRCFASAALCSLSVQRLGCRWGSPALWDGACGTSQSLRLFRGEKYRGKMLRQDGHTRVSAVATGSPSPGTGGIQGSRENISIARKPHGKSQKGINPFSLKTHRAQTCVTLGRPRRELKAPRLG